MMDAKKKLKVSLVGAKSCGATLKAKVWLELQKIEYAFVEIKDIEASLNNKASETAIKDSLSFAISFLSKLFLSNSQISPDSKNEKVESGNFELGSDGFKKELRGLEFPIVMIQRTDMHSMEEGTDYLTGFSAHHYLDFLLKNI